MEVFTGGHPVSILYGTAGITDLAEFQEAGKAGQLIVRRYCKFSIDNNKGLNALKEIFFKDKGEG